MGLEGIVWKLYDASTWFMRMIYLNILWIAFTLLGLVVFGFFPATVSMFSITRKWIRGEKDFPMFKTFLSSYKVSFIQINIIGSLLTILGIVLYIDLRFFQTTGSLILSLFNYLIIFAFFIYFVVFLYIFPMYVHFKLKTFAYMKHALIIVLGKPIHSIMMVVGSFLIYTMMSMLPVMLIFVGGSLLSLVLMWIAMRSFPKHEMEVGEVEWN